MNDESGRDESMSLGWAALLAFALCVMWVV